jgi:hypothetical protein
MEAARREERGGAGRRGLTGDVVATVHVITNNPERDSL